jgi:hypothetical protein
MARFRLKDKHYLNVEGSEYDHYEETETRVRGRRRRSKKTFEVPMYLDPTDPADHNYDNQIIVSTREDPRYEYDYILRGEFHPTFEMEPLDEEAREIYDEWRANHSGEHPIDSLPGTMGEQLLDKLVRQLEAVKVPGMEAPASIPNVSVAEMARLKAENASLSAKVDQILAQLAATAKSAEAPKAETLTRRI